MNTFIEGAQFAIGVIVVNITIAGSCKIIDCIDKKMNKKRRNITIGFNRKTNN